MKQVSDKTLGSRCTLFGCIILAALAVHFFGTAYLKQVTLAIILMMIMGISWDILARTGQASFGQSAYFGISVYATAILAPSIGVVSAWVAGVLLTMVAAALMGMVVSRLQGRYFAISTMAFSMAMRVIVTVLPFTGGSSGISTPVLFRGNRDYQFLLAVCLLLLAAVVSEILLRPRRRTASFLIRSNAYLASSSGVPVFRTKIFTASIAGGVAALAGALYGAMYGYVLPADVFVVKYNVMPIAVSILGGVDSTAGPIIGGVIIRGIEELTKTLVGNTGYQLFVGLVIIICVVAMPNGLLGKYRQLMAKRAEISAQPGAGAGEGGNRHG